LDKHELDLILAYGTYLPVPIVVARQSRELRGRARTFLYQLQNHVATSSMVTAEMREALAIGAHLLGDDEAPTTTLIAAKCAVSDAWRAQSTASPSNLSARTQNDEPDSALYREGKTITSELLKSCQSCLDVAERVQESQKGSSCQRTPQSPPKFIIAQAQGSQGYAGVKRNRDLSAPKRQNASRNLTCACRQKQKSRTGLYPAGTSTSPK